MGWPQITYLCLMMLGLAAKLAKLPKEARKINAGVGSVIASGAILVGYTGFICWLLHKGGFW